MLKLSHCVVDLERRIVETAGRNASLTTREAHLLAWLAARPSTVVSREDLLREVWGYHHDVLSRAIDNAVCRLRSKIEADPMCPVHLLTEFGVGYRLVLQPDPVVPANPSPVEPLLVLGIGPVDLTRGVVFRSEGTVTLASGELALLRELVRTAGPAVGPHDLERRIWGNVVCRSNRLRSVVWRLRTKIERDPANPVHLIGVKGHGYRFVLPETAPASGRVTVLVANIAEQLAAATLDEVGPAAEHLWTTAVEVAATCGGYPSSLGGGQVCLVFARADGAVRAGLALSAQVPGARVGLATGEVRRFVNPLSQRFEYLGPPVVRAERRCRHLRVVPVPSQSVLADQASERVAAA